MTFSESLRQRYLAIERGRSLRHMAMRTGVDSAVLCRWRRGGKDITLATADRIHAFVEREERRHVDIDRARETMAGGAQPAP